MDKDFGLDEDLALAHALADAARSVSMTYFRRSPRQWRKRDGSLVTEADEATEDEVRRRLASERPTDAMLGEERGQIGTGRRRWIVDAIDGTVHFAAGLPKWETLIALEVDGRVVVGVCDSPAREKRCWAVRGGGAFRADDGKEGARVAVSRNRVLEGARSFVPPPEWLPDRRAQELAEKLSTLTNPAPPEDHPALQVAFGGYDVAFFFMGGAWDVAAPSIVVEEAGGKFTDFGGRYALETGCIFSNGLVHDAAVRITGEGRSSAAR
ncbi:MAG TPA: inositol monophosphatase family protein [Gammaproteobacteria bacterium]|nr:inositol monophosphatase family protein [Gammaproteobacteria bacterium]